MPQLHMGADTRMARLKQKATPEKPPQKLPATFTWTSGLHAILILDSSYNAVIGTSNNPSDIAINIDVSGIEIHRTKTEIIAHCSGVAKPKSLHLPVLVSVSEKERSYIIFLYQS